MNWARLTLLKKIGGAILGIVVVSCVAMSYLQHSLYTHSFETVFSGLEKSVLDLKRNSAADILREVKIATESSLARGEYDLFTNFAKKQKEIEEIRAFSFYGKTGVVELSSEQTRVGQSLEKDLWKQAQSAKGMIELENDQVLSFYYPLRVNRDMRRLRPTWKVGDIYGVLHLEFSKDKIKQMASAARNKYDASSRWAKNVVMIAVVGAVAIASLLSFLLCRAILKPLRVCMLAVKGLAKKDFSRTCQVKSKDEVGQMAQAINENHRLDAKRLPRNRGRRQARESQHEREQEQQRYVEEERCKADDMQRKVNHLLNILGRVAKGDYSAQVDVTGQDALGQLGDGLRAFFQEKQQAEQRAAEMSENEHRHANELRRKVDYLLEIVGAAAQGDLTKTVKVEGNEPVERVGLRHRQDARRPVAGDPSTQRRRSPVQRRLAADRRKRNLSPRGADPAVVGPTSDHGH